MLTGRSGVVGVLHYKHGWGYGVYTQWRLALSRGTQYVGTSGSTPALTVVRAIKTVLSAPPHPTLPGGLESSSRSG